MGSNENDITCNRTQSENAAAALVVMFSSTTGLAANGFVIMSYFTCASLRNQPSNFFITNLAVADFMSAAYIQLPCIINLGNPEWHFNGMSCVVHSVLIWTIMTSSNWILAAISTDRAIAINKPFQYSNLVTTCRVRWTIVSIWAFSLVLASSLIRIESVSYNSWELMCSPRWTKQNHAKSCVAAVLCFWLPSTIMLLSNLSVICAARRLNSTVSHQNPEEGDQTLFKSPAKECKKTLRSLYVLVIVYIFCGSPYFLAKFSFITRKDGLLPPSMVVFCMLLMFTASAINPFVYALLRKDHREALFKTARMLADKNKKIFDTIHAKIETVTLCCR